MDVMTTRSYLAQKEHEVAYQDILKLIREKTDKLSALEMLAVAANLVGKLVAMQNQSLVTPQQAMEIVARNIEEGNKHVIERFINNPYQGTT